jgi:hypothetical protein
LNPSFVPSYFESLNILVRRAGKEEQLVKIPLAGQFCLALGQIRVLGQLSGGQRPQRHDRDLGFSCEGFQRFCGSRLLFSDRYASEPAEADSRHSLRLGTRRLRPQVEIVLRKENPTAILGDEGVGMGQFPAGIVQLEPGAAREPNRRDPVVIEGCGEFVEAGDTLSVLGNQAINGDEQNEGSLAQWISAFRTSILAEIAGNRVAYEGRMKNTG